MVQKDAYEALEHKIMALRETLSRMPGAMVLGEAP